MFEFLTTIPTENYIGLEDIKNSNLSFTNIKNESINVMNMSNNEGEIEENEIKQSPDTDIIAIDIKDKSNFIEDYTKLEETTDIQNIDLDN